MMKFDLVQLQQMTAALMYFLITTSTTVSSFTTFWTPVNNIKNDNTADNRLRRHHRRLTPRYSADVHFLMRQNRRPCHRIFFSSGTRSAYQNNDRNAKGSRTVLRLAATSSSIPEDTEKLAVPASPAPPALYIHHTAIKTSNITTAIQFYSLFGFTVTCKFRAGPARAAWLELNNSKTGDKNSSNKGEGSSSVDGSARLELIEVPSYMLNQSKRPQRAINLMERQELLGHNHLCLDVTSQIAVAAMRDSINSDGTRNNVTAIDDDVDDHETTQSKPTSLSKWLQKVNEASLDEFDKTLRVALEPRQQLIGRSVYELAFLYDADGSLVELLNLQSQLKQNIESGWEPLQWDVDATDFLSLEGLQQ